MANRIKMETQQAIISLQQRGWSIRKIARELEIHRKTVKNALLGTTRSRDSKCTGVPPGSESENTPSQSLCQSYQNFIEAKLQEGLSGQRIYQDLRQQKGFAGGYDSVKRFVRRLKQQAPHRYYRIECDPGEEAQVDFGTAYALEQANARRKKAHILRVTLSYSRKSYSEAVSRQTTECFIRCLENAFRYFGGEPRRICLDNLKAAVAQADWYEPQLNPKILSFADHYDCLFMPTRPYCPQHKGKVESAVKYVKNNALKGRRFASLKQLNEHLRDWEKQIADKRIHGTTRAQVQKRFTEEKPHLKELPLSLFASFQESPRQVHVDSYIQIQGAYYQVPAEYIGARVWARWDGRMVRLYDSKMRLIRSFAQLQKGQFSEVLGCEGSRGGIQKSLSYWQSRVRRLGPSCVRWSERLIEQRGEQSIRILQGLNALNKRYGAKRINEACHQATLPGQYQLKAIKDYLNDAPEQQLLELLEEHELIRDLSHYQNLINQTLSN